MALCKDCEICWDRFKSGEFLGFLPCPLHRQTEGLIYDPPSGWQYGFPQFYMPIGGETVEQTLIRDGYPEKEAEFAAQHTQFTKSTQ